jgi:hypothetical protein
MDENEGGEKSVMSIFLPLRIFLLLLSLGKYINRRGREKKGSRRRGEK